MTVDLSDSFYRALDRDPDPARATVFVLGNAGNWRALFPAIKRQFPAFPSDSGVHYPIVFGGDEHHYLTRSGSLGAAEFKGHVLQLLHRHARIFVFDTQKIQCLQSNPSCMADMLIRGKSATLYFRDKPHPGVTSYLKSKGSDVLYEEATVSDDSMSVIATKVSARVVYDALEQFTTVASEDEKRALQDVENDVVALATLDVEDHFLSGGVGTNKMREVARRKILSAVLRATTRAYSVKSDGDPVAFFRAELAEKFARHQLPTSFVVEVSPNLGFVVKKSKRFAELTIPVSGPRWWV